MQKKKTKKKNVNEFEFRNDTIYLLFIIHNKYFDCLLIYDFMSTIKLV